MIQFLQSLSLRKEMLKEKRAQLAKDRNQDFTADELFIRLNQLEQKHEQLKLTTMALWHLLRDHTGLTEADLKRYIEKTDLLDGKRDGKVTQKKTSHCQSCRREVRVTTGNCTYCGSLLTAKKNFSGS